MPRLSAKSIAAATDQEYLLLAAFHPEKRYAQAALLNPHCPKEALIHFLRKAASHPHAKTAALNPNAPTKELMEWKLKSEVAKKKIHVKKVAKKPLPSFEEWIGTARKSATKKQAKAT